MSTTDGPLVYLRLDDLSSGNALDSSGNALDAATRGGPTVVADDTFGSVLQLDGVDDALDLPAGALPDGGELSVCVWLNGDSSAPADRAVLYAADTSGVATVDVRVPDANGAIAFSQGGPDGTDAVTGAASSDDYAGAWTHWAFVRDADGVLSIYRNGVEWTTAAGSGQARAAAASVTAGAAGEAAYWPGKMAHLRIYTTAVTADDLSRMISEDQTALSSFRRTYPFDVYLHDGNDQEVLYITDSATGKPLNAEISNQSGLAVTFVAPSDPTPGSSNYHFALRFRPGTLSTTAIALAQAELDAEAQSIGWSANVAEDADGTQGFYFLNPSGGTLETGDTLALAFSHASADASGGSRGTRVEMRFAQVTFGSSSTPVSGRRTSRLNVINDAGSDDAPLLPAFQADAVLNDGQTLNTLTLRIANTLTDGSVSFSRPDDDAPTKLFVSFDTQDAGESHDWALATTSQAAAIVVTAKAMHESGSEDWSVEQETEGETPEWMVAPTADSSLGVDEWLELTLSGIVTSLGSGPATVYLRYENLPGYADGLLTATLRKSVLVENGGRIGIGTASPDADLEVAGSLAVEGGVLVTLGSRDSFQVSPSGSNGLSVNHDGKVGIGIQNSSPNFSEPLNVEGSTLFILDYGDSFRVFGTPEGDPVLMLTADGAMGIGTSSPLESIHTTGNLRADGGQLSSAAGIQLRPDTDNSGDAWVRMITSDGTQVLSVEKGITFDSGSRTGYAEPIPIPWSHTKSSTSALKLIAKDAGVLAVSSADVLEWESGKVYVKGDLYAGNKYFRIPHPLNADAFLVHGCLEGPEQGVYYRGTARLEDGRAIVRLPDYFEALTLPEGRTVQLTARGREPFVLSHAGVADGAFEVFGTRADGEFDWEVRATRADSPRLDAEPAPRGSA